MSEPASSAERKAEALTNARTLLAEGRIEQSLSVLKSHWLENPSDAQAVDLFADVVAEAGRAEPSSKLKALSHLLSETPPDERKLTSAFFEAGFGLIDLRQFELAIMLLLRCYKDFPDDPVINYEIGFCLMSLARWDEAIAYFMRAKKNANDFDTNLNLAVCYTLTRKLKEARETLTNLGKFAMAEDERKELAHRKVVLKRLESFSAQYNFTARDWLYVLYGGILLRNKEQLAKSDEVAIVSNMLILRGLLEGLRIDLEVIEYYNPLSKPLAMLLSRMMELPLDSYKGPDRPERALLVMAWATDIIGPHQAFIEQGERRVLFSYGLDWKEPLPIAPDIVACMTSSCPMPWDEDTRTEAVEKIIDRLAEKARDIENDPNILNEIQDAVQYYDLKRELIVLTNHETFPERPEYTAEIPR
jgi:Flp pilus assembly protein TadD